MKSAAQPDHALSIGTSDNYKEKCLMNTAGIEGLSIYAFPNRFSLVVNQWPWFNM